MNRLTLEQQPHNFRHDFARRPIELLAGQIRDRMRHIEKAEILESPRACHRIAGADKYVGDDRRRRHAVLFEYYAVEHTARAARPSIADACDDDVAVCFELVDDFLRRRHARAALAAHDMRFGAVIALEETGDPEQQLIRIEFRIVDEPNAQAGERGRPRRVGNVPVLLGLWGGIKYLYRHDGSLGVLTYRLTTSLSRPANFLRDALRAGFAAPAWNVGRLHARASACSDGEKILW